MGGTAFGWFVSYDKFLDSLMNSLLIFRASIRKVNIFYLATPHSPARLDTFVLAKVSKTACQSNALCSLIKVTALLMRSPSKLSVRLLGGPSLAPVAHSGKT